MKKEWLDCGFIVTDTNLMDHVLSNRPTVLQCPNDEANCASGCIQPRQIDILLIQSGSALGRVATVACSI
jgi:hypothetical protein